MKWGTLRVSDELHQARIKDFKKFRNMVVIRPYTVGCMRLDDPEAKDKIKDITFDLDDRFKIFKNNTFNILGVHGSCNNSSNDNDIGVIPQLPFFVHYKIIGYLKEMIQKEENSLSWIRMDLVSKQHFKLVSQHLDSLDLYSNNRYREGRPKKCYQIYKHINRKWCPLKRITNIGLALEQFPIDIFGSTPEDINIESFTPTSDWDKCQCEKRYSVIFDYFQFHREKIPILKLEDRMSSMCINFKSQQEEILNSLESITICNVLSYQGFYQKKADPFLECMVNLRELVLDMTNDDRFYTLINSLCKLQADHLQSIKILRYSLLEPIDIYKLVSHFHKSLKQLVLYDNNMDLIYSPIIRNAITDNNNNNNHIDMSVTFKSNPSVLLLNKDLSFGSTQFLQRRMSWENTPMDQFTIPISTNFHCVDDDDGYISIDKDTLDLITSRLFKRKKKPKRGYI